MIRLASVLFLCAGALLAQKPADDLIKQVQQRYNGARTLSVDFVETYSMQGHERQPEAGTLTLRKQGKMRWDYSRPAGKLFVSDGKSVYLYTAADNRVEKVPLKDTEDMRAPLAFLLGRLDMRKEFRDFTTRPGEGGMWLDATAKTDRLPYGKVQMLITAEGSIQQLKVVGRDESELNFRFSEERLNPPVPETRFRFVIPPGAEVVDSVAFTGDAK
ncbi:MAG TPA: outer membrane lipoprotein carrier protein LolA [Bryobacteraceae bacterium]|nr:outer membrane lipoprotein carrier protein LolA [Bryobacteraceae bacterium]